MKVSDTEVRDSKTCAIARDIERSNVRSFYIFIIEAEANLTMITRLHNIFSRSRIPVIDFQAVQVGDGLRVLITVREAKETVVKLYHQLMRQVEIMGVELFAPLDLAVTADPGTVIPFGVRHVSQPE